MNAKNNCYLRTQSGALDENNVTKFEASRTSLTSNKTPEPKIDIFGTYPSPADSAHLIPHSRKCAAMWFSIVPWVLHVDDSSNDRGVSDCTKKKKWDVVQKCIHGSGDAVTEEYVGIKRFPTNRINLSYQAKYFDAAPCVIIIPILKENDVKNWSGNA